MKILDKNIVKKLKELSMSSKKVAALKKERTSIKETTLESEDFKEYSGIINSYETLVEASKKELSEEIKMEEIQREMLREEIVNVLASEYDGTPINADVPTVGKVRVKIEKKKVFEADSVPMETIVSKLLELGELDCLSIDKEKYEALAKKVSENSEEDLPGIIEKDASVITIKESVR
jgi:hypothetical protein